MNRVEEIVQHALLEATANEKIDRLVDEIIKSAINTIDPSQVINNFEAASEKYYTTINKKLAKRLNVTSMEAPQFITTYMRREFRKALEKYKDRLEKPARELAEPVPRN